MRSTHRRAGIGVLALVLAACTASEPTTVPSDTTVTPATTADTIVTPATTPEVPRVEILATDFAFDMPDEVPSGVVEVTLRNDGNQTHHAQLARLNDGVTLEQIDAAPDPFALSTFVGGPNAIAHGDDQTVTLELEPGQYIVVCLIPDPADGVLHVEKGMIRPLVVTDERTTLEAPTPEGTIELADFSFALPDGFDGNGTFAVSNTGTQPHEISLARIADGKTFDDVAAWAAAPAGPPPYTDAGGFAGIAAGATGYVDLDLEPGNYVAFCFIPDPASGMPHIEMGMVAPFTIS